MGVIIRQGLKTGLVRYIGVFVAALATLFIYPRHTEAKGELEAILAFATLFVPFAVLGGQSLVIRFFPLFRKHSEKENGFLWLLGFYHILSLMVFSCIYLCVVNLVVSNLSNFMPNAHFILTYKYKILIITWILAVSGSIRLYISNFKLTTVSAIINYLSPKIIIPILFVLLIFEAFDVDEFINYIMVLYGFVGIGLFSYLMYIKWRCIYPDFNIFGDIDFRAGLVYALYGMLGGIGSILALQMDVIMVRMFCTGSDTGVFAISSFVANVIQVPTHSLIEISSPIIAGYMANNNISEVGILYKKISLNLLTMGIVIFSCVWSNIYDILYLTGRSDVLLPGVYVILWVGLSKLLAMATSVNGQIISYSKYFRFNFYTVGLLAILNIVLNLKFIPKYGIVGAALATFISLSIFNTVKLIYVWWRFKIQPFTIESIYVLLLGVAAYLLSQIIPDTGFSFLNIVLKSSLIMAVIGYPVLRFRFSDDLNRTVGHVLNRLRKLF